MSIYSVNREKTNGLTELAHTFFNKLGNMDLIIISFAEYNGAYTSAFKNIFDWKSRANSKIFQEKPTLLMYIATGERGGSIILEIAKTAFHIKVLMLLAVLFYQVLIRISKKTKLLTKIK